MTSHIFAPFIFPRPSMEQETHNTLIELADSLPGQSPHFLLTYHYDVRNSKPSSITDIRIKLLNGDDYSLSEAHGSLGISILAKARFLIEIDPLLKNHVDWVQGTYGHPFGAQTHSLMMQIMPGIVRLYSKDIHLTTHTHLKNLENGHSNAPFLDLSCFFMPPSTSGHDRLIQYDLLAKSEPFWKSDFAKIKTIPGPKGTLFSLGPYTE